ncbi:MAG: acetaldehyde dehydrogenase (acetylating) [Halieaceae bacterium]|nr:acetaldehyde dehydrogenase (acetylating) [Halieaceae bacterium]
MSKIKCAIIGSGNIGTDLMIKVMRTSKLLEMGALVGIDPESDGLARARKWGIPVTDQGIDGLVAMPEFADISLVFDATSAKAHARHAAVCKEHGKQMIDLTPAAIGPFCVPTVNLDEAVAARAMNVNMVTCGGQATIPLVYAVSRIQEVSYAEIVATVSSKSAGPGTRKNIDEFTRTTAEGIRRVGGAEEGKAIIIINPAEPPLIMRDTIHCLTRQTPDQQAITDSVHEMIAEVQQYVPGYTLKNGPVFDGTRVSIYMEVEGKGDFLPKYAGNLDIMTAAGLRTAEIYAEQILSGSFSPDVSAA